MFDYNSVDWKSIKLDLQELASQYGIKIIWMYGLRPEESWFDTVTQSVHVPANLDNDLTYATTLHEIGHAAFLAQYGDHPGYDPGPDGATQEEEWWVNHFMLENAEIPISNFALQQMRRFLRTYEEGHPDQNISPVPFTADPPYGWMRQTSSEPSYKFLYDGVDGKLHIWPIDERTEDPHHHEYAYEHGMGDSDAAHWDTDRYAQGWLYAPNYEPWVGSTWLGPEHGEVEHPYKEEAENAVADWMWKNKVIPFPEYESKVASVPLSTDTTRQLTQQVNNLANDLNIKLIFRSDVPEGEAMADVPKAIVYVPAPTTELNYLAALHEFGHIEFAREYKINGWGEFFNSREQELWAWHWALEHALIPVSNETLTRAHALFSSYNFWMVPEGAEHGYTLPQDRQLQMFDPSTMDMIQDWSDQDVRDLKNRYVNQPYHGKTAGMYIERWAYVGGHIVFNNGKDATHSEMIYRLFGEDSQEYRDWIRDVNTASGFYYPEDNYIRLEHNSTRFSDMTMEKMVEDEWAKEQQQTIPGITAAHKDPAFVYDPASDQLYHGPFHAHIIYENPELEEQTKFGDTPSAWGAFNFTTPLVLGLRLDEGDEPTVDSDYGTSTATDEQKARALELARQYYGEKTASVQIVPINGTDQTLRNAPFVYDEKTDALYLANMSGYHPALLYKLPTDVQDRFVRHEVNDGVISGWLGGDGPTVMNLQDVASPQTVNHITDMIYNYFGGPDGYRRAIRTSAVESAAEYMYHVSSPVFRASILQHGLDSEIEAGDEYSGNWLWPNLTDAEKFGGDDLDIWRVNIDGLDVSYEYMNDRVACNTFDPISPDRLTLISEHTSTVEKTAGTTMYHVAPSSLRETIEQNGLHPNPVDATRWGPAVKQQPEGLYLFSDIKTARDFRSVYGGDIWEVHPSDAVPDPGMNYPDSYYTNESLPATLVGTEEDLADRCINCGENERLPDSTWCRECTKQRFPDFTGQSVDNTDELVDRVRSVLTPDLLHKDYRDNPKAHCYVATEALYHLLGGPGSGYKPMRMRVDDNTVHWWLQAPDGSIIDPTHDQFDTPIDYTQGKGAGFLTKQPSQRAQIVIDRVGQDIDNTYPNHTDPVHSNHTETPPNLYSHCPPTLLSVLRPAFINSTTLTAGTINSPNIYSTLGYMHTVQTEDPHQASTLGNPRSHTQGHLFENGTIPSFLGYASNGDSRWLYSPQTGLVIWPMEISNTHSAQAYEMGITDFIGGDIWYDNRKVDEITLDHNSNSAWIPEAQKELLAQGYNPTLVDNLAGTLHEFKGKNVSTWRTSNEGWTPSVRDREEEHYDMIPFVWNNGRVFLGEPGELHSSLIYGNDDLMALWNSETFYTSIPDMNYVGRIFDDGEVLSWDEDHPHIPDQIQEQIRNSTESNYPGYFEGKYTYDRRRPFSHASSESNYSQRLGAAVKIEQLPGDDREGMDFIKFIYVPAKNTLYWWLVSEYNGDPYHATMEYDLDLSYPMKWIKGYIDPDEGLEFYPDYNPQTYQNEYPAIPPELQKAIDSLPGLLPKSSATEFTPVHPNAIGSNFFCFVYVDDPIDKLYCDAKSYHTALVYEHPEITDYVHQGIKTAWGQIVLDEQRYNNETQRWEDVGLKIKFWSDYLADADDIDPNDKKYENNDFNEDYANNETRAKAEVAVKQWLAQNGYLDELVESHLKNSASYTWFRWLYDCETGTMYAWPGGENTHEGFAYSSGLRGDFWGGYVENEHGAGREFEITHIDYDHEVDRQTLIKKLEEVIDYDYEPNFKIVAKTAAGVGTRLRWLLGNDGQIHIGDNNTHNELAWERGVEIQWGGYIHWGGTVSFILLEGEPEITATKLDEMMLDVYHQAQNEGYQPDGTLQFMYVPYAAMPEDKFGHIENDKVVWNTDADVTPDEFDEWQQNFSKTATHIFDPANPPSVTWQDPTAVPDPVGDESHDVGWYKFEYTPEDHNVNIWPTNQRAWPHHQQMKYVYDPDRHNYTSFIGHYDVNWPWIKGYGQSMSGYDDPYDEAWKRGMTPFIQNAIRNQKTADLHEGPVNEDAFGPDEIHWEENFVYGNGEVAFGVTEHSELAYENGMYDDPVCGWIFESNHMPTKAYVVFQSIYYGGEAATPQNKKEIMNILRNTGRYRNGITEIPYESWMGEAQMDGVNGVNEMWSKVAGDWPLEIHEVPEEAVPGYDMGRPTQRHPIIYDPRSNEVFIGPYNSHHQPVQYKYGLSGTTDGFYNPAELNNGRSYSNKGIHWFAEPPDEVKQALEQHFNEPYSKVMNWDKGQYEKF